MSSLEPAYTCLSELTTSGVYAAGRCNGFSVFDALADEEKARRSFPEGSGVRCIGMLSGSPIIAFVGEATAALEGRSAGKSAARGSRAPGGAGMASGAGAIEFKTDTVYIYDDDRSSVLGKITCPTEVIGVQLRSNCVLIRTGKHMYVHSLDTLKLVDSFPLEEGALCVASEPAAAKVWSHESSGKEARTFRMVYTDERAGEVNVRSYTLLYTGADSAADARGVRDPRDTRKRSAAGSDELGWDDRSAYSTQNASFSGSYDGPGAPFAPTSSSFVQLEGVSHKNHKCHKTKIARIAISLDGTRFASVSDHGTVVRVFRSKSIDCIATCRRGTSAANILHLYLDRHGNTLLASSDHNTIHKFDLTSARSDREIRAVAKLNLEQTEVKDLFLCDGGNSVCVVFAQMSSKKYEL